MILEKLQKIGLSDKESQVYKALFELGDSVVTDVAKQAKVNRSTAYVLIESLSKRGLISVSEKQGIKTFSPVPPEKITEIAKAKLIEAGELVEISKELSSELQKLTRINRDSTETKVNVFAGKAGVKTVFNEIISTTEAVDVLIVNSGDKNHHIRTVTDLSNILKSKSNRIRVIVPDAAQVREELSKNETQQKHGFFLSLENNGEYSLVIFGKKIAFISPADESAFILQNAQFTKAMKTFFEVILQKSRRWNVKNGSHDNQQGETTKKDQVLVQAEKRFWSGK